MSAKIRQFIWVRETVQCKEVIKKLIEEAPSPVLTEDQRKDLFKKLSKWLSKLIMREQVR